MYRSAILLTLCISCLIPAKSTLAHDEKVTQVPPIELIGIDGKTRISVAEEPKEELTVLCFLGTECPLARLYAKRLRDYSKQFEKVRFIGINSNVQDSVEDINGYVVDAGITFEFAKDYDNRFADQLNITRTPEVVVFDQARQIVYRRPIPSWCCPFGSQST